MEILIQENISDSQSRSVFAKLSTEVLSLEDVVLALSEIIDDEAGGYYMLPFISTRSEVRERPEIYASLHRVRAYRAYMVSNGKNTIYMLDYIVKAKKTYHDPIICIIGPDTSKIADKALRNLSSRLLSKTYNLKIDEKAVTDFSNLMGYRKSEVVNEISRILEEAEIVIKMKLLKKDEEKMKISSKRSGISKEILKDMRQQKPSFLAEQLDLRELVSFGAIILLITLLFMILAKL